jgi:hypothetical protein
MCIIRNFSSAISLNKRAITKKSLVGAVIRTSDLQDRRGACKTHPNLNPRQFFLPMITISLTDLLCLWKIICFMLYSLQSPKKLTRINFKCDRASKSCVKKSALVDAHSYFYCMPVHKQLNGNFHISSNNLHTPGYTVLTDVWQRKNFSEFGALMQKVKQKITRKH